MLTAADFLPRAVNCHRALRLAVDADAAWALVGDIGSPVPGGGMIERVEVEGSGAGAIRTFVLAGGACIVERIEDYDPVLRRYVYRVLDPGPMDFAHYLGVAQVVPAGVGCILSWTAIAQPVSGDAGALAVIVEANLDRALAAIADHLGCRAA